MAPPFKDLRQRWLDWLKTDPVQSTWTQINGMMWDDATFRAINEARSYTTGGEWLSQNGMCHANRSHTGRSAHAVGGSGLTRWQGVSFAGISILSDPLLSHSPPGAHSVER